MIDFADPKLYADPKLKDRLMQLNPCFWALENKIKLMGNTTFTLDKCGYMQVIMLDPARYVVTMKGAQARITTAFLLRSIHALRYGVYPQGVIYYFPSRDAVEDFSKTRATPLINDNPCIRRILKSTDSVFVKKVGKAFLTFKGATATKNLKGRKKDSTSVRSTPADEVIRDERDLFDDDMVQMTKDRLLNSEFKREVDLGTPTIPDFGIAKAYEQSDQKRPLTKCTSCGQHTSLADDFPNSVKYRKEEPYFACIKCGEELNPFSFEFVARYPDREISGYHIPHLITPHCELSLVMDRWRECQIDGSKMGSFYNSILGLPYIPAEDRLTESDVFACCGNDVMRTEASIRETAMGVDIGKAYHTVLIGEKIDDKRAKVVYACRVKGFDVVGDISKKYNVKSAVICLRPYEEEFGKFRDAHSKRMRIFGAEYSPSYKQRQYMKIDEKAGIYTLHKTQAMDKSHAWVKSRQIELPRKCEEMDVVAAQLCGTAKVLVTDERTGDRYYQYIKVGSAGDHYRSALNYLQIALGDLTHYQGMAAVGYGSGREQEWDALTFDL